MQLTTEDKVRIIAKRKGVTLGDISAAIGCSRQNMWKRLRRGSYTLPELQRIGAAIGCAVDVVFTDTETGETL